jgi:hypothetical protein
MGIDSDHRTVRKAQLQDDCTKQQAENESALC